MGIKNLNKLIAKYANNSIREKSLSQYSGKIIAIDISIYLYKFTYMSENPTQLMIQMALHLVKNGITPVFVFDGRPPEEKAPVLAERKERIINLTAQKELIDSVIYGNGSSCDLPDNLCNMSVEDLVVESDKLARNTIRIKPTTITQIKEAFNILGIPMIYSDGEAETLCAKLSANELIDGCISEDTDILPNGGKIFIRGYNISSNKVKECCLNDVLTEFNISLPSFVDMCILCGCDYTTSIKNIGPNRAYTFIKKYGSIENMLKNETKFKAEDDFNYIKARELFNAHNDIEKFRDVLRFKQKDSYEFDKLGGFISGKLHKSLIGEWKNCVESIIKKYT